MSIVLLILLFVVAWVVLILPKQRELKRHNALVAALTEGDEVMSGSGIYGTITAIHGDVIHLEVAPGIEIKVARRAVASKVSVDELELEGDEGDEGDDEGDDGATDESGDGERVVAELESGDADEMSDPLSDGRSERS